VDGNRVDMCHKLAVPAKDADARGDRSQTDRDDLAMIADAANAVKSARCYPWR
jgi:hypothetical protein